MGFFGQIIMSTTRTIESYNFDYINNTPEIEIGALELKRIFDHTKWIIWGSEYLTWYTFDEDGGSSSVELKAYFNREYGTGEKVYYDEDNLLSMNISRFGEKLILNMVSDRGEVLITATVNLRKK